MRIISFRHTYGRPNVSMCLAVTRRSGSCKRCKVCNRIRTCIQSHSASATCAVWSACFHFCLFFFFVAFTPPHRHSADFKQHTHTHTPLGSKAYAKCAYFFSFHHLRFSSFATRFIILFSSGGFSVELRSDFTPAIISCVIQTTQQTICTKI